MLTNKPKLYIILSSLMVLSSVCSVANGGVPWIQKLRSASTENPEPSEVPPFKPVVE